MFNYGGTATLTNSTVSGNSGGVLVGYYGTLNLANTILANSLSGGDCVTNYTTNASGVNLVEDGSCGSSFPPNTDPNLGPLAPNGGPTQTHALLTEPTPSPAIDAVTDGSCPPPNEDQRGVARPQDGDGDTVADCDIGSFEVPSGPLCFGQPATILGTPGNDSLIGTPGDDVIVGRGGNDQIDGRGGHDKVCGNEGKDRIRGSDGNDMLSGDEGSDDLDGGNGNDRFRGGSGFDTCIDGENVAQCEV